MKPVAVLTVPFCLANVNIWLGTDGGGIETIADCVSIHGVVLKLDINQN